ncbi:MAG: transketolase [Desulfovibrionaceae bacterium]|nr:transketolase [Desulfovibrionaceae bacterium]
MNERALAELKNLSNEGRRHLIRMIGKVGVGHVGGALSVLDVMVYLYFRELNLRPDDARWSERDRFVMSKGHAGPALYTVLAMRGFFGLDRLETLNSLGTNLPSHCDMKRTTGVDMTAGSLGQGLSAAVGMALAARMDKKSYRVYCIVGDGEMQEGQIWEAAMYAGSQQLDNLVVIVDDNGMQIDNYTDAINSVRPIDKRLESFGFETISIDGHDFNQMEFAFYKAKTIKKHPTAIIMSTVKGKGFTFCEGKIGSHNMAVSSEDLAGALNELA